MADEGAVAVLESPEVSVNSDISSDVPNKSIDAIDGQPKITEKSEPERQDGRRQPDALRKRVAELRRQADTITDPVAKAALLSDAKALNDTIGKARAYEEQFPTVREVREVKALLDSVGGREGFQQMQATIGEVERIDALLEAGDPSVLDALWEEAKNGMPKLVPAIIDRLEKESPQEYEKAITPHAVKFFDNSGFPVVFDRMVQAFSSGKTDEGKAMALELATWFSNLRQGSQSQQQQKPDPEVERLRAQLAEKTQSEESRAVDSAYNAVVEHAGPTIDKVLKPIIGRLGLSTEQYNLLRGDVWDYLQKTRNADPTYKTVAKAKQKQGYDAWTEYAKGWTTDNVESSAQHMAKLRYGHQLKNGAKSTNATVAPGAKPTFQTGKEPGPAEIDYGPKGTAAARKAGFRDVGDMILSGQAPLKSGGIRKWR
jgi:hypothetical protein